MPLFFMVSGYLSYKCLSWNNLRQYLNSKSIRLLIPWLCTIPLNYYTKGSVGYWFLISLFEMYVLNFFIVMFMEVVNKNNHIIIDMVIIFMIYLILTRVLKASEASEVWTVWGISFGKFAGYFLPFFVGVLLRKYPKLFAICVDSSISYTCWLILFCLFFARQYFIIADNDNILVKLVNFVIGIGKPLLGSLIVIHLFYKGTFARLGHFLIYIGQRTMPIYILHLFFVIRIPEVGNFILSQDMWTSIAIQIVYGLTISFIAIGISLIVYRVLNTSVQLKLLLFGER